MANENKMLQNDGARQGNVHIESDSGKNEAGKQGSTLSDHATESKNVGETDCGKQTPDEDTLGNP